MTPDQAVQVLRLWEQADLYEDIHWHVDPDGSVRLYANCSDLFYWATADAEEIVPGDLPLLIGTLNDLKTVDATYLLPELFSARKRKLRPQKPCYEHFSEAVAALFDACCTEKERAEASEKDAAWWLAFAHSQRRRRGRHVQHEDSPGRPPSGWGT